MRIGQSMGTICHSQIKVRSSDILWHSKLEMVNNYALYISKQLVTECLIYSPKRNEKSLR
jgi:hypothetical protein